MFAGFACARAAAASARRRRAGARARAAGHGDRVHAARRIHDPELAARRHDPLRARRVRRHAALREAVRRQRAQLRELPPRRRPPGQLGAAVGRVRRVPGVPDEEPAGQHVRAATRAVLPVLDERTHAARGRRRRRRARQLCVLARDRARPSARSSRAAASRRCPSPRSRPSAKRGADVYRVHCAACHGANGGGLKAGAA